jgi:cold shock CspA family protein
MDRLISSSLAHFLRYSGRPRFRKFLQEGQTVRFDLTKGPKKGWQAENVQAV